MCYLPLSGITVSPASQTIVQGTTASFSCVVTNGLGFWMINETWVLPSVDFSTYGFAIAIDQQDDGAVMSIVAEGRASNNNTRITCVSIDNDDSSVTQVDAYLLVAGWFLATAAYNIHIERINFQSGLEYTIKL